MAKRDTVAEIKAINGVELDDQNYTQTELDQLKAVASDAARFSALKKQFDDDGSAPGDNDSGTPLAQGDNADTTNVQPSPDDSNKRRVKLGPKSGPDTTLLHPTDKVTIGNTPVLVTADNWVAERVRAQELDWA